MPKEINIEPTNIAFEHFSEIAPSRLWRVIYWRSFGKEGSRKVRCSDYYATENEAWEFVGRRIDAGVEVIRIDAFDMRPISQPKVCGVTGGVVDSISTDSSR